MKSRYVRKTAIRPAEVCVSDRRSTCGDQVQYEPRTEGIAQQAIKESPNRLRIRSPNSRATTAAVSLYTARLIHELVLDLSAASSSPDHQTRPTSRYGPVQDWKQEVAPASLTSKAVLGGHNPAYDAARADFGVLS